MRGYAVAFLGVVAVAVTTVALWPDAGPLARRMALVGVALCAGSGVVSLWLKAQARTVNAALMALVMVFGFRAAMVVLGALLTSRVWGEAMPFVYGFFGTYFPLQWVEISFLVSQSKRQRQGQEPVERR